jgi:uncharacterized protein (DUF736 family)
MKLNFSLFKNTYKEEGSNQPDYVCSTYDKEAQKSTKIGGGWIKEGKNGKFISISIDDEYKKEPVIQADAKKAVEKPDYDDAAAIKAEDIPF